MSGGLSYIMTTISFQTVLNFPAFLNKTWFRTRSNPSSTAVQLSSIFIQTDDNGNPPESKKITGSVSAMVRSEAPNSLLTQASTVGILGGVSVFSTLIFLEKLVCWSSRHGEEECIPFVVCSDPTINREFLPPISSSPGRNAKFRLNHGPIVEKLRCKRAFLEQSGARCIVMPCHLSHAWHSEVSEGCPLPFLHVGECVASELKAAKLRPLEAGSNVRIGVLGTDETLMAGFYTEKLETQGFEVVLPDMATMEHIVIPGIEAIQRKDMEGARNLMRIAVNILLVRGVNVVVIASDEMQCLLPRNDPLSKKCINPMDALARSTLRWAKSIQNLHAKPLV